MQITTHQNLKNYLHVKEWQNMLQSSGTEAAETIVLSSILEIYKSVLRQRLEFEPLEESSTLYLKLKEAIHYINWMMDRMAEEHHQKMVLGEDRVLFEFLRNVAMDMTLQIMEIEAEVSDE